MTDSLTSSKASLRTSAWSNRILIAAVVGILFLTLYPFEFAFSRHLAGHNSSFLLGGWGRDTGRSDVLLNILLFLPFGFGLAEKLRERGKSRAAILGLTLAAGALLSYTVEFLQYYIPSRDSGWEDVVTNSTGSVVGFLLFELCGAVALRILTYTERELIAWLTLWRAIFILILYFGLWLAISIPLQEKTRLSNWEPDSFLVVGAPAAGGLKPGWKGEIFQLELWDHALPREFAQDLTSGGLAGIVGPTPLATYDLSTPPPFRDQQHFLPDLIWESDPSYPAGLKMYAFDGQSWLASRDPVFTLVDDVRVTRQFALRVRCEPSDVAGADGRIVSILQVRGAVNLELRQVGANLVFWFRNPLSVRRSSLAWNVPNIFAVNQPRDVLLSYDGSDLSLYVDGKKDRQTYRLSPAAGLAQLIRRIRPVELDGYWYFFYALVFFPAGIILELALRKGCTRPMAPYLLIASGILIPSLIVEVILVYVSGRPVSVENIALSIFLALGGALWFNSDSNAVNGATGQRMDAGTS